MTSQVFKKYLLHIYKVVATDSRTVGRYSSSCSVAIMSLVSAIFRSSQLKSLLEKLSRSPPSLSRDLALRVVNK